MTRSNSNRRAVYLTAVGLLVISLGAFFVVRSFGSEAGADGLLGGGSCDDPVQVKLSTTPDLQPQLESAAKSLAAKGGEDGTPCLQFTITGASSAKVAQDLASGSDQRPDLWVPDSSLWVARADDGESIPSIAVPSVATSPLVLVGRSENFANTSSWLGSFGGTQPALLDPLGTSEGALPLLAIQAERAKTSASNTQVASVLVPLAQRLGSMAKQYTEVDGPLSKASADGSNIVVPVSEHSFVKYQEDHPEAQLKAIVPGTGTLVLDYPVVVTARSNAEAVSEAGKALAQEMLGDAGAQARDDAGFRDHLISPLGAGRGVGDISQLTKPTAASVDKTLQSWATLSLSAHSLAVIDVSGSMAEKVAGSAKTRMQLTIEAAESGLKLFPDTAALGLWTFSTKIGDDSADYRKLVGISKLTPAHRGQMLSQLKSQTARVGGGTGLYDTAIAAVREVRSNYDSSAVNTVLLFTDGKNDDPGSPSLDSAIQALGRLRDPARPVRIIALGIGPDADATELNRLAQATGGRSYVARNPTDLQQVFIDALQSR
ncbi:substrate-binding domain-containing protein [Kribbella amoyensis]|uniref:substrate-binding domain-containing protein n=1 Tax=Kribbella amoyensis TaxID=996641 RepID=UPI001EE38560|nr:substrate-binding domain-containing protein [Kribbella amoyensis]